MGGSSFPNHGICFTALAALVRASIPLGITPDLRPPSGPSAIDFGQFRLRPVFFFRVRPIRLRPISTSANFWMLNFGLLNFWPQRGPEGWRPKILLFFSLPPQKFVLFFPLWGSFRGILVVFEAPGRSNVHVWSSLVVVWSPGGPEGTLVSQRSNA